MVGKRISRRAFLRRAAAAASLATFGSFLVACGATPTPKVVEKLVEKIVKETVVVEKVLAPAKKASITLIYNTWWPRMADDLLAVIPIFEARFPHVKIKEEVLPYMEWIQKYETTMVAGTAPDTFCGNLFITPKFYDPAYHMDFTDRLKADGIDIQKDHFITATEIWCGRVFGMPFDLDCNAMFYNKDIVKKYYGKDLWADMGGKWTWQDWVDIMIACTQDINKDGKIDQWGADGHMPNHENWNQSMSFTRGGTIFDYDTMKYTWTSDKALETAKMGHDLWMKSKVFVPPDESKALAAAGVAIPFAGGVVATRYRAVADMPRFITAVGTRFKWDCIHLPGPTKDKPGVALIAGNPNVVYAKTKNPDEAYEWVKFLAMDDVQGFFARQGICVPTLKRMVPQFKKYPEVEHAYIWAEVPQNDYHIHILHYNAIECRNLTGTRMDEVYSGGANLEATIKKMNDELNAKVDYGKCMPFKGMKMPIPGGKLVQ